MRGRTGGRLTDAEAKRTPEPDKTVDLRAGSAKQHHQEQPRTGRRNTKEHLLSTTLVHVYILGIIVPRILIQSGPILAGRLPATKVNDLSMAGGSLRGPSICLCGYNRGGSRRGKTLAELPSQRF
ncbi:hypothetical protein K504DRAFT_215117 [Pleomassaria siparia CBS 279.74]|uniref:Uncharacterized protein n=1 Tax=Pleomassaria siparia CBS 279.74 TaxID=1314801 RepID=A0A6G1JQN8_9PLEO|nr:hypothetical protein K504DRAFT_215117 [Pleomassaria siparia CBS 279.74]